VYLSRRCYDWIIAACEKADSKEVGGFAYVTQSENGFFIIDDPFLVPQEVSCGEVDYENTDGLSYAIEKSIEEDRIEQLRCSWHSHGSMNTFWSNIDEEAIDKFRDQGTPWIISLLFNNKGNCTSRIDIFNNDLLGRITLEKVEVNILSYPGVYDEVDKEYKKLVKEKKYPTVSTWKTNPKKGSHQELLNKSPNLALYDGTVIDHEEWMNYVNKETDGFSEQAWREDYEKPVEEEELIKVVKESPQWDDDWLSGLSEGQMDYKDWETLADLFDVYPTTTEDI